MRRISIYCFPFVYCMQFPICNYLPTIQVSGNVAGTIARNFTVGETVGQHDNQSTSARSMGIVLYRSDDSQPHLDHSLLLLVLLLVFSFYFLLLWFSPFEHISTTFQTILSFLLMTSVLHRHFGVTSAALITRVRTSIRVTVKCCWSISSRT